VGDLRQVEGPRGLWTLLQKLLLGDIQGLVLTSRFFADYFSRLLPALPRERIVVIDNKVHRDLAACRPNRKTFSDGRIIIGVVGLLRYRRPLELLLEYVRARRDTHVIECFGDGPLRDLVASAQCENIRYHGSFKNPDALPDIYARVDLNYVVYDNASENVRLALPNKLYESAFFGVPILCCDRTRLGELAMEWGVGKTIRIGDPQAFFEDMDAIDREWLQARSTQCLRIPPEDLLDDGDAVIGRLFGGTGPAA
jgi:glycosyltransferase involved in cell wall biosynthesis